MLASTPISAGSWRSNTTRPKPSAPVGRPAPARLSPCHQQLRLRTLSAADCPARPVRARPTAPRRGAPYTSSWSARPSTMTAFGLSMIAGPLSATRPALAGPSSPKLVDQLPQRHGMPLDPRQQFIDISQAAQAVHTRVGLAAISRLGDGRVGDLQHHLHHGRRAVVEFAQISLNPTIGVMSIKLTSAPPSVLAVLSGRIRIR